MNATICPACAFPFAGQADESQRDSESQRTVVVSIPQDNSIDDTTRLLLAAGRKPLNQPPSEPESSDDRGTRNVIVSISESCRIVSFGNMDDSGTGFRTRLEVSQQDFWLPVVRYEINEDASLRHTFNLGGMRKATRLDLPSRQAKEMAENDLTSNAEKYCAAFLAGADIKDSF